MLSYQHSYHAGCLADVHKHALLSVLLTHLVRKERPLSYVETHSGRGVYDLDSEDSQKTGEAEKGIKALQKANIFPKDHPYMRTLLAAQRCRGSNIYLGSPAFAKEILRPQDDLYLMELHPQEIKYLHRNFRDENVHIHFRDGYEGVLAIAPPKARRGLVLIDPSYEIKTEYQDCVSFIKKLHQKWPQAVIALWYPMLEAGYYKAMIRALDDISFPKCDHRVFRYARPKEVSGLFGTGLYFINTPWGVEAQFDEVERLLRSFLEG
ncbi:MAG: 23S rRNA (adenine(2030)-N(6))-methyltransferase RlmJ [Alphaproteobacteria bacterium]|nr:23S rRNA (adenine(2030)-N(6))-methyltransferase RlmJ [Alphaproteobacteria bacterium]NCQ66397.1 23S rRNA (adenine(2030)-N(6))-methyltransferase RlmJ [Alphaproteobacteria bacterium]NCT06882.1 23S rRNA (adenine(2030)-N(6))-methyltransferase RlmJ [Alphaproteobacteria bacterium]